MKDCLLSIFLRSSVGPKRKPIDLEMNVNNDKISAWQKNWRKNQHNNNNPTIDHNTSNRYCHQNEREKKNAVANEEKTIFYSLTDASPSQLYFLYCNCFSTRITIKMLPIDNKTTLNSGTKISITRHQTNNY